MADSYDRKSFGSMAAVKAMHDKAAEAKKLVDDARIFEQRVKKAIELLDPYMDSTRDRLVSIYQSVGDSRRRKAVIQQLDRQISLLLTFKHTLERSEEGQTDGVIGGASRSG